MKRLALALPSLIAAGAFLMGAGSVSTGFSADVTSQLTINAAVFCHQETGHHAQGEGTGNDRPGSTSGCPDGPGDSDKCQPGSGTVHTMDGSQGSDGTRCSDGDRDHSGKGVSSQKP